MINEINENKEYLDKLSNSLNNKEHVDVATYMSILQHSNWDIEKADKHYAQLEKDGVLYLSDVIGNIYYRGDEFGWILPDVIPIERRNK